MSADRIQAAAEELYGLVPDEFTSRRDALAKEAKGDGDAEAAKAVKALRRPTTPAWLVNLLVRQHGEDVDRLLALGVELRNAQSALEGPRMKQLSAERTVLVETLAQHARQLAAAEGQEVTAGVERDVEETLRASVVDPRAADAAASGQLTRALAYAGLGEVDLSEATATPARKTAPRKKPAPTGKSSSPKKSSPPEKGRAREKQTGDQTAAQRRQAAASQAAAEQTAVEAMDQLEAATAAVAEARQARETAEALIADLQQRLSKAGKELTAAKKQQDKAERAQQRSERSASAAKRALDDLLR